MRVAVLLALVAAAVLGRQLQYELNPYESVADPAAVVVSADGMARFTVLTSRIVRMEYARAANKFEDLPTLAVVNRKLPVPKFTVSSTVDPATPALTITTESIKLTFVPGTGPFNGNNLKVESVDETSAFKQWDGSMRSETDPGNLLGTYRTLDQRDVDSLNCTLNQQPHCVFGLISRSGWALVDDTDTPLLGDEDWWADVKGQIYSSQDAQDWYLLAHGTNYRDALYEYTLIGGKIPLPPRYTFGIWWTRWFNMNGRDFRGIIDQHRTRNIPLDVFVFDMNWHKKNDWTGFSFDRQLISQPEDLFDYLKSQENLVLAANLHDATGVNGWEDQYVPMAEAMGIDPKSAARVTFDLVNRSYAINLEDIVLRPLEKLGMDFWWIDWQQGESGGRTKGGKMNPTIWTDKIRATNSFRRGDKTRNIVLARFGGLGNHRYQVGFSGDVKNMNWQNLAYQPYFSATSSNVGYGFWSHDIVGPGSDHELYTRWVQWGAFSAVFRNHERGTSSGGCMDPFPTDNENRCATAEIWNAPPKYFETMRSALVKRAELLPYLYTQARFSYESGLSIVIPMYYFYPDFEMAYANNEHGEFPQYFLGEDILVSPVVSPSNNQMSKKIIWLPPTQEWFEEDFGTLLNGPYLTKTYHLSEIPRFVKAGAIIPKLPYKSGDVISVANRNYEHLQFAIYPASAASFSGSTKVYEDDGFTYDYNTGSNLWTSVNYAVEKGDMKLTISTSGSYEGAPASRSYSIELLNTLPPSSVALDGVSIPYSRWGGNMTWTYNGEKASTIIYLGSHALSDSLTVAITGSYGSDRSILNRLHGLIRRANLAKVNLDETQETPFQGRPGVNFVTQLATLGDTLTVLAKNGPSDEFVKAAASATSLFTQGQAQMAALKTRDANRIKFTRELLNF